MRDLNKIYYEDDDEIMLHKEWPEIKKMIEN